MEYVDLDGNKKEFRNGFDGSLSFLYTTAIGRLILKPVVSPRVSRFCGKLLDTKLSTLIVPLFIKRAGIDMSDYEDRKYTSFNDFFTRTILPGARPVESGEKILISPCDSYASVYPIRKNSNFIVKNTEYTLKSLLRSKKLAKRFEGGYLFLLRLTVSDYHRYCYPVTGSKTKNIHIDGVFHTVNPVANDCLPIYRENTREYTLIRTKDFADVIQMEVGALLVGRIKNHDESARVTRGCEKGYFEYGGSTVIVLTQKDTVIPREDLLKNTEEDLETKILQGQKLGEKA